MNHPTSVRADSEYHVAMYCMCSLRIVICDCPKGTTVQQYMSGGQIVFGCSSARTMHPHGGYVQMS